MASKQYKALFVDVPVHKKFKVRAAKEDKTFTELLSFLLDK